ncbi:MAG: hypothetical protein JW966_00435 [Anaerolineae bacterium]|nr:hypothetical protein [Anaerolineae bacterium]
MSNQDDSSDFSSSLLRRLLNEKSASGAAESPVSEPVSPADPEQVTLNSLPDSSPKSPVRPTVQDDSQPQDPLTPSLPNQHPAEVVSPREQMQRAEEALISLRQKMAKLAAEFSQGKLNPAQFDAIYSRYSEQRDIIERLLTRNPESQAWQSVVQSGHTSFLRQRFEARVLSYAIYNQQTYDLIMLTGTIQLDRVQIEAVMKRLVAIIRERGNPGPAHRKISDGRCVLFVPGDTTVAMVIYSLEPSAAQIRRVQDIHRDFERANKYTLSGGGFDAERLVYPHRALFEEKQH